MLMEENYNIIHHVDHGIPTVTLTRRLIECVGPVFLSYWQVPGSEVEPEVSDDPLRLPEDDDHADEDPHDVIFLRSLDPKDWKEQDHYAVLGLRKLRYKATEDDIKKAYRLKVLRHHPDKRRARGEEVQSNDDYFTCITRAYEMLGNPQNRISYDSVDPQFDDKLPVVNEHSRSHFYKVFGKVFHLNSRWSEKKPVPKLGDESTPRDCVEHFYSFWYDFQSWREFSYYDDREREYAQGREERKLLEKINKASRAKRKKEEMARIRTLVDTAYNMDPRVQRFKQEDKDRKIAAKEAKKVAARARHEEEERKVQAAEEEMRRQKEEAEAEQRAKQEAVKAEREAQKRALKKERAALRKIAKEHNYFAEDSSEVINNMASLEKICECLRVEELEELVSSLALEGRLAFIRAVEETERRIEQERQELMASAARTCGSGTQGKSKKGSASWTHEQLQLLIKAVNIFPAGTYQRWEVVANFINQHSGRDCEIRSAKEVLAKAKDLQSSDYSRNILKFAANKKAYDTFEKDQKHNVEVSAATSQRFDSPVEQQGTKLVPWTAMEQQLLEQALKTYPVSTPDRWDRIAECLPSRTKKDCMRRYKELVEMVKAKKAAQAAVTSSDQKSK